MLKIDNLTKYYGSIIGIKNLSLEVHKGEIFGFIGPNGSGKSTTIRAIMGLLSLNDGTILIDGGSIENPEIKKGIGYLPSEVKLYENDKIKNLFKYNDTFYKYDTLKKAFELSKKLNLDVNKKIDELSFGNLKKVGIVLALAHSPKLIILDEPTSGLDPLIQSKFFEILREEKEKGCAILFSSHTLSEIKAVCDRVAILKNNELLKIEDINNIKVEYYKISIESKDMKKISNELKVNLVNNQFLYDKDINELIGALSKYKINKILIEEPTLEDIFMEFYKEDQV